MKKLIQYLLLLLAVFTLAITGCKKDKPIEPEKPLPTLSDIEVGLGDNEMGVIGKDFHFNAKVLAGEKIDVVQIKIVPRTGETYAKPWEFEKTWTEFKGAKNATVHKHFNIPADAVEGKYDFLIIVNDENGTVLEEKRAISIYTPENLPIDPSWTVAIQNSKNSAEILLGLLRSEPLWDESLFVKTIKKDDLYKTSITVQNVKGNGKTVAFFVNKKHKHRPETIAAIDFSKVIVIAVKEHKDTPNTTNVSATGDFTVGSSTDNNTPPSTTTGDRAWEDGQYSLGLLYYNETYKTHIYYYRDDITVNMN